MNVKESFTLEKICVGAYYQQLIGHLNVVQLPRFDIVLWTTFIVLFTLLPLKKYEIDVKYFQ